ncbi:MAG TPA: hypothetical protein VK589_29970 [Chryseolinea sp.]|nr:hypothetical protein [Chryseolinea sp.]
MRTLVFLVCYQPQLRFSTMMHMIPSIGDEIDMRMFFEDDADVDQGCYLVKKIVWRQYKSIPRLTTKSLLLDNRMMIFSQ